jgi:hypothetical protein
MPAEGNLSAIKINTIMDLQSCTCFISTFSTFYRQDRATEYGLAGSINVISRQHRDFSFVVGGAHHYKPCVSCGYDWP